MSLLRLSDFPLNDLVTLYVDSLPTDRLHTDGQISRNYLLVLSVGSVNCWHSFCKLFVDMVKIGFGFG